MNITPVSSLQLKYVLAVALVSIIGSNYLFQRCSDKKIEEAIGILNASKSKLDSVQTQLLEAKIRLDIASQKLGNAQGYIDTSDKIIQNITNKLWDLRMDIEKSKQAVSTNNQNRKEFNEELIRQMEVIDRQISDLKSQLNRQ